MREDFQIPNFGEGPVSYEKGYLNRLVRNIEMTFRALKAKGPINATTVSADQGFTTSASFEVQRPNIPGQNIQIGPTNAGGHLITGYSSTSNAKNIIYNATTDDANTVPSSGSNRHLFQIRGAEKFTIDDDGAVSVVSGWLKFPATAVPSTDANTLDEYQEGTWTPTLAFGGASTGITYSTQQGTYVKIGRVVTFQFRLIISSKGSATGNVAILGLPFAADNYHPINFGYGTNFTGLTGVITGYMENNSANISLRQSSATGVGPILTDTVFTATTDMIIGGSYISID